jgi:hypothetical protein
MDNGATCFLGLYISGAVYMTKTDNDFGEQGSKKLE